jgi:hypothetical protein
VYITNWYFILMCDSETEPRTTQRAGGGREGGGEIFLVQSQNLRTLKG